MLKKVPKYMDLVNWIKEKVERREFLPGARLPSEHELSGMFKISRQTVRKAISILEEEEIVESRQGSGTYVCNFVVPPKATMNIAVYMSYVDGYIFPSIIQGIEKIVSKYGYSLQISFTNNRVEKESLILKNLLEKGMVDGIISEPTKSGITNPNIGLIEEIVKRKIPLIFINTYYPNLDLPHVCLNDEEAGYIITKHLLDMGHRKIAGIFKADDGQGHRRYAGYLRALQEAGELIHDERVLWIDTEDLRYLTSEGTRVLRRVQGCTACVCYNDITALALAEICEKNGIQIPQDLSIVGIDNCEAVNIKELVLTSVNHPSMAMGEKVASNLMKLIAKKEYDATYEFPAVLVEGNSVKRISGK